jgi:hypothetical protein
VLAQNTTSTTTNKQATKALYSSALCARRRAARSKGAKCRARYGAARIGHAHVQHIQQLAIGGWVVMEGAGVVYRVCGAGALLGAGLSRRSRMCIGTELRACAGSYSLVAHTHAHTLLYPKCYYVVNHVAAVCIRRENRQFVVYRSSMSAPR